MEIPCEQLRYYCQRLRTSLELLGLGPILLLYTPRHLLERFGDAATQGIWAAASSEESAHRNFAVLSNVHGSFLFHPKHFWLLEQVGELTEMGMDYLRLDWQGLAMPLREMALEAVREPGSEVVQRLRAAYPAPLIRGFYHHNKSAGRFGKLKNCSLERWREVALGQIVGVERGRFLGVWLHPGKSLLAGGSYQIKTPEGRSIPFVLHQLYHPNLSGAEGISQGLAVMGYVRGGVPGGLVVAGAELSH